MQVRCDTDNDGRLMDFITPCESCSPAPVAFMARIEVYELNDYQVCPGCGSTRERPKGGRHVRWCDGCKRIRYRQYLREWRKRRATGKAEGNGSEA